MGADVVDALFPFEDPLGKVIQLQGLDYTVIGITERQGQSFGQSQDNYVFIPITTFLQRYGGSKTSLSINVEAESAENYDETLDEVIGIMRTIRKVSPGKENDFEITTNDELMETFGSFTGGVKIFANILTPPVKEPNVSINSSLVVISKSFSLPGETFLIVLIIPITSSNVSS